jgi:hypothetical protein
MFSCSVCHVIYTFIAQTYMDYHYKKLGFFFKNMQSRIKMVLSCPHISNAKFSHVTHQQIMIHINVFIAIPRGADNKRALGLPQIILFLCNNNRSNIYK